jgi:ketosteroid isomerase-like protein
MARSASRVDNPEILVAAADDARLAAMQDMDITALEQLLADDLVYIHSTGKQDSKEAYLASLRSGHIEYTSVRRGVVSGMVLGNLATVLSGVDIAARIDGEHRSMTAKSRGIWVRRHDRWQLMAMSIARTGKQSP